ncbi:hypothetical protein G0U57_020319 [Chelydra serpentina]|uniref:Uncharacterized protein n=1 Tax=Chelydra serpentina TaxID=8475 RepID=A0A8T1S3U0_CHESE|nr:hypothetical protein G0U57_020319 [Chelydra serpentina]
MPQANFGQSVVFTSSGTKVAHGPLILKLLEAIHLPSAVAIIHVRAHQKGNDPTVWNMAGYSFKGSLSTAFRCPPDGTHSLPHQSNPFYP